MLNNKWIRILCYTLMGLVDAVALILIILGISELVKEESNSVGCIYIIIGIIIPIGISVGIYPIFALANIDKNFTEINNKYDAIIEQMRIANSNDINNEVKDVITKPITKVENTIEQAPIYKETPTNQKDDQNQDTLSSDLITYLNNKYALDVHENDSLEILKMKIENIDSKKNVNTITFKARVALAKDMNEAISLIKMHKVVYE